MANLNPFHLSVLDLAPVPEGADPALAFSYALQLAQFAEQQNYQRYWLAEHHNMPGIASAATAVLIGYLAANTQRLRLGSGGVMLPNHAPIVIAEQFGTLDALYPGRIDLGIGRAPGSDQATMQALRRPMPNNSADSFPEDVMQLLRWFDATPEQDFPVSPTPGTGQSIPVWLLGSSLYSAQLAAQLGLPFAFASHFAPDFLSEALALYRGQFRPSSRLQQPYVMMGINVVAASSKSEAEHLFSSQQQQFINLRRGKPTLLPAPVADINQYWLPHERLGIERALAISLVGDLPSITHQLRQLQKAYQVDEFMVNGQIYHQPARIDSFGLAMRAAEAVLNNG
jgi:luciferase family oxidoreductase group 1